MDQQNTDPSTEPERFFTIKEIAEILRIDPDTVEDHIRERRLRAVRVGKRSYRVPYSALEEFIRTNSTIPPAQDKQQGGKPGSTQRNPSSSSSDGQVSSERDRLILSHQVGRGIPASR